ncbi:MAG: phosphoribosylaminoimidazolecarboxamide formyltransferase [Candidatus Latescibacterota bacterium]|nr:phosphoribosylaminoimidazolecarboxamide formyltransferase [Candidatus Latescibacterota bacterium]
MSSSELSMRYGCNPHQVPARCYRPGDDLPIRVLNDTPSYINLMDALNAWQLARELKQALGLPAAASFKHLSPAGAAVGVPLSNGLRQSMLIRDDHLSPLACAYARARGADRLASFGDFIAMSDPVDISTANLIRVEMSHGIIAPGYEEGTLEILSNKLGGTYKVLEIDHEYEPGETESRVLFGITLEQRRNDFIPGNEFFTNVVSARRKLTAEGRRDLTVATIAVKYTQSNSVVLAVDGQVVGAGAGQQSRVHCVRLAADKADRWALRQHPKVRELKFAKGLKRSDKDNAIDLLFEDEIGPAEQSAWQAAFRELPEHLSREERRDWLGQRGELAMSSDAFFPFRDSIDRASRSGVEFVVEAGGSKGDESVIQAADEYGMLVIFSGIRLFHH